MRPVPHQDFDNNVVINCPFDSEYNSLLQPILFTILHFGFTPQIGEKPHDHKKVLSDLAGIDASSHMNNPEKVVLTLRNWFIESVRSNMTADSATAIWHKFVDFNNDFYARRKSEGFSKEDLKMMPVSEYISFIQTWLSNNK